ncbi:hypothetical protein COW36_00140 [bacterium (Candidatus Blackallbacteria) CG17_big_fil_post_rev_8_21_14_2_50_48_46]|uniref:Uncharacterized protein n=1 Tax=bacterium (Candidatus Blackallbacteria) CG17_big_fil_post_rev_8_21_14_2_50_48_46 TaxID=2014261 RepID=A0A2M7GBR3_9BACT|nr:MAG: hypothetical protein COW64_08070 [bacterium (Candidatus Blackallbacteria) CG18_big_fil_WC_8_21_14_2_50_49_26]PIW19629.1 MAG: hypothetical protein COW36_00140 [bacterium (Candidatus Blackallbacteria) CG17_big_fil_post_rev_8_21_14_2_50_48_46]
MPKFVVAYDLHKPFTVSENYVAMENFIEKSFNRAEKVLNTTFIVTDQGSGFSISNAIQGFVKQNQWSGDTLVSEIKPGELYVTLGGHAKSYSSF